MVKKRVKNTVEAMYGREPSTEKYSLSTVLNWYNVSVDYKKKKAWALAYAKELNLENYEALTRLPDVRFGTVGAMARIMELTPLLDQVENLKERMVNLIKSVPVVVVDDPNEPKKRKLYSESRAFILALTDIDNNIDNIVKSRRWLEVEPSTFSKLTGAEKTELTDYVNGVSTDMVATMDITTDDVVKISRVCVRNLMKYTDSVVNMLKVVKAPRKAPKARKKKVTPASKLVAKMVYLQSSEEYGLNSIDVTKIIGAKTLLVFNVKARKVGMYEANTSDGLTVSGTTLKGFGEELSTHKTVRKPMDILPKMHTGARNSARKQFKAINAVDMQLTGRINKDTLILRAW